LTPETAEEADQKASENKMGLTKKSRYRKFTLSTMHCEQGEFRFQRLSGQPLSLKGGFSSPLQG